MIGKSAPDFEAVAVLAGSEIGTLRLAEYRGQWVLLFFYPASFTFNCASEVTAYADRQPEFSALSCALIGASCDSAETHLTWNAQARLEGGLGNTTLNLIGDHDKSISERYGVLAADKSSQRASFLIGPDGMNTHNSDLSVSFSLKLLFCHRIDSSCNFERSARRGERGGVFESTAFAAATTFYNCIPSCIIVLCALSGARYGIICGV